MTSSNVYYHQFIVQWANYTFSASCEVGTDDPLWLSNLTTHFVAIGFA